ncbi:hypothetical protein CMZ82_00415 [Lysobacteraceae bacterium NML93-0792]|nr:hypothetical protein CMZ82_00415 [Xanthomonadaceae bacterium NML93-0792]PBS16545.1 hypothetical protein CMZ81_04665 [Xanthomonadaceae bacterium NML93-0793]PBS19920.1 hypothetical protein CMZ80_02720 [Xanthomonadaceae bacterium NML93-0831]
MLLNFPPPANWQDFQILTARLAELMCIEGSVHEYGRQGQRQAGVDVYGELHGGEHLGVQCKEMELGKKLSERLIRIEADKALKFEPALKIFVVATTLPEDTGMHRAVTNLNQSGAYPFRITHWSWKHFNDMLNRSNHVVQDSYERYARSFGYDQELEDLEAIRAGFDRPAFIDDFMHEVNYEDFVDALGDTILFLDTGLLRDRYTSTLVSTTYARSMLPDGPSKKLRDELKKEATKLRRHAIQDLKTGRRDVESARFYNARRLALLATLNRGLRSLDVPPIAPNY